MKQFRAFVPARAARGPSLTVAAAAAVVCGAVAVPAAPGVRVTQDLSGVRTSWVAARDATLGFKEPPGTVNRFLAVSGRSDDFGYAYLPWARALWRPFRWEASVGLPFAERTAGTGDAVFGIEVATNRETALTYAVQARRSGDGLDVTASGLQGAVLGTKSYPATTSVDLAIEHDGSEFRFSSRAEGASSWDSLGSSPEILPEAMFPVMSVYDLAAPGMVAFDDFRIVQTGVPDGTSPAEVLLGQGFDGALDALHRLDGNPPNLEEAGAAFEAVRTSLAAAVPETRGRARKKARAALAQVDAVLRSLRKGRPVEKAVGPARKAVTLTNAARLAVGDL